MIVSLMCLEETNTKKEVSSETNWNKRNSLFVWYLENKKSLGETFYISAKPHFRFHWQKAWFFSYIWHTTRVYHKNWRSCFLLYRSLAIFFSLHFKDMPTPGKSFWEFKKSLTSNVEYVEKKKEKSSFRNSTYAWPRQNN